MDFQIYMYKCDYYYFLRKKMAGYHLGFKVATDLYISRFRGLLSRFSTPHLWLNAITVVVINVSEKRDAHEKKIYGGASTGGV
jgi:hypothetical protein